MHVVMAAGGTAGHIEPALNTADTLRTLVPGCTITVLGTERGLERTLVPARGYPLVTIPAAPFPRRLDGRVWTVPTSIWRSVTAAHRFLVSAQVDVLVGFGGYASAPAYLAARWAGVPILVHEANARPGWANRLGARLTGHVAAVHAGDLPRARGVGMPLRADIRSLVRRPQRPPVVLVFGGSQGAQHLNEVVTECLGPWLAAGIEVVHLCGATHEPPQPRAGYRPMAFSTEMARLYAEADLVVCRAGAMTCAEIAAVGLPAIFIPLASGNGEQELNAKPLVDAGGALLIRDQDLTAARLTALVEELIGDQARLQRMSERAAQCGRRDADRLLAEWIIAIAEQSSRGAA